MPPTGTFFICVSTISPHAYNRVSILLPSPSNKPYHAGLISTLNTTDPASRPDCTARLALRLLQHLFPAFPPDLASDDAEAVDDVAVAKDEEEGDGEWGGCREESAGGLAALCRLPSGI
jgi:hypothetical protein